MRILRKSYVLLLGPFEAICVCYHILSVEFQFEKYQIRKEQLFSAGKTYLLFSLIMIQSYDKKWNKN